MSGVRIKTLFERFMEIHSNPPILYTMALNKVHLIHEGQSTLPKSNLLGLKK